MGWQSWPLPHHYRIYFCHSIKRWVFSICPERSKKSGVIQKLAFVFQKIILDSCHFGSWRFWNALHHHLLPFFRIQLRLFALLHYPARSLHCFLLLGRAGRQFPSLDAVALRYRFGFDVQRKTMGIKNIVHFIAHSNHSWIHAHWGVHRRVKNWLLTVHIGS